MLNTPKANVYRYFKHCLCKFCNGIEKQWEFLQNELTTFFDSTLLKTMVNGISLRPLKCCIKRNETENPCKIKAIVIGALKIFYHTYRIKACKSGTLEMWKTLNNLNMPMEVQIDTSDELQNSELTNKHYMHN